MSKDTARMSTTFLSYGSLRAIGATGTLFLASTLVACGNDASQNAGPSAQDAGSDGSASQAEAGAHEGIPVGGYPPGTIALVGKYSGSYRSLNQWTWATSDNCLYFMQARATLALSIVPGIVFDQKTKYFDVKGSTDIVVDGTSTEGSQGENNPACATTPRLSMHGRLTLAPGRYEQPLVWKGEISVEQLDTHDKSTIDMDVSVSVTGGLTEIHDLDAQNTALSFDGEPHTKTIDREMSGLDHAPDTGYAHFERADSP